MAGSSNNTLRAVLHERGWSYTRLAAELRRHAGGSALAKTESLVTLISRWVNNHQQPDDFYRDLLAKALGRSRTDLFGDEGTQVELAASVAPAELPHDVADFIGRASEIDECRRRLFGTGRAASGAVVTIDGSPGVGKSALAVHLAHELCEHFPNAQLFANLRGDEGEGLDPTVVLHQFLRALGATSEEIPSNIETAARAFRSRLAGRRVLVVLDNAVSERQVRPLLPGSPTCAVLITSRCPLPGLAEATALTLELFPTSDAVRMLEQVAGAERVGASEAATRVVSQCGHLPLALRIAGARLRTRRAWTVETLAVFMEDERQRLGRLAMGELGVRASFSLSYQQLEPEAARTFRLLSLLGMPEISVGVAASVTDRELPDAEAALDQLADAALVEALTPGRYRFHDLLRLFARERAEAEEAAETRRAVVAAGVDWYLAHVLEAAVLLGPARSVDRTPVFAGLADALVWLDLERENLVRAVVAAGERDLVVACWQMADALFRFYELRRYLTDWQQVNQVALHAAERASLHEVEGRMHNGIGYVYAQQARFDQALEHLEAALVIRREVGDAAGEGRTLKNLGDVRIQLGQPHEALLCYEQALAISLAVGDRHRQGQALHGVGVALAALGRLSEAEHRLEEALWIRLEMGDKPGEARTRLWLGNVRRDQGWHAEARAEYEASLVTLRSVGDRYHEGIALWQIGVAAQQLGESDTARATWRQALAILEALGCTEAEEVRGLVAEEAPSSANLAPQTE
jgi:tetratricopeptide (TPR) repeat protein